MTSPDLGRAWALFVSDPADFIAMFAIVIASVFGFTWWLRNFVGKERKAALEKRLQIAKDKPDTATSEIKRLTTVAASLESQIATLQSALPAPALQQQLNPLRDASASIRKSATKLSTANNALGAALWVPDERSMNTATGLSATRRSD